MTLTGRKEAFIRKYYDLGENFVVIENLVLSFGWAWIFCLYDDFLTDVCFIFKAF